VRRTHKHAAEALLKSFIRDLSAPVEFLLIVVICFWWAIGGSVAAIAVAMTGAAPQVELTDDRALWLVIVELAGLALVLLIARIRGWSPRSFGWQISWKRTGEGMLLFLATGTIAGTLGILANVLHPGAVSFAAVPGTLSVPMAILVSLVNPLFEETIQVGYFVHALRRFGMWPAVLASAAFRGFLHTYQGLGAVVVIFPLGVIFCLMYWRRRQLWPLILAHMLFSLGALIPLTVR
jgi:membrane protease YdiL (CAAX protease family)